MSACEHCGKEILFDGARWMSYDAARGLYVSCKRAGEHWPKREESTNG